MSHAAVKMNKFVLDPEYADYHSSPVMYGHHQQLRMTDRQTTDWAPTTDDVAVVIFLALLVCVVVPSFIFIHLWTCKATSPELIPHMESHCEHEKSYFRRVVVPFFTPQTLFAACYLFCTAVWNSACQVMVDHWTFYEQMHAVEASTNEVLPDIGFYLLPHIKSVHHIADTWNAAELVITAAIFLTLHPARAKILKRFCFLQGTLFMLRSVTIVVTLLPNPYKLCVLHPERAESFIAEGLKVMGGSRYTCGDVMYSGHSVNMTIMNLVWQEYYPSSWRSAALVRSLWWMINIGGLLMCVTTHFHYTVDVLIGSVLACLLWALYHRTIRYPKLLAYEDGFIGAFLFWYECGSDCQLSAESRKEDNECTKELCDVSGRFISS